MKNSKNFKLMLSLWAFAVALCALVIILMLIRGPAVTP
jgi:hypothetical protein